MIISNTFLGRGAVPLLLVATSGLLATSCMVGPDYKRPPVATPAAFKRAVEPETKEPVLADTWWTLFNDPALTKLVEEAVSGNFDLRAAMARAEQAHQSLLSSGGSFYPALNVAASARRSGNAAGSTTVYTLPLNLSYEFDVWGRLRRPALISSFE